MHVMRERERERERGGGGALFALRRGFIAVKVQVK
jgi:hypothetical protein